MYHIYVKRHINEFTYFKSILYNLSKHPHRANWLKFILEFLCQKFLFFCLAFSQDTLYPFGPAHRDIETPKMDDGSSPEIQILTPFIFFNVPYRSLYVSVQNMEENCSEKNSAKISMQNLSSELCNSTPSYIFQ